MLTAADDVNGDILYTEQTGFNHGVVVDTYQDWSWPAQPVTGQLERTPPFSLNVPADRLTAAQPPVTLHPDSAGVLVRPAPAAPAD
jgi:hypothetical protein